MWLGKLFGRSAEDDHANDEPARFSAPQAPAQVDGSARATNPSANVARPKPKKGFDPYNSGAFERKNAWERTNLR